MADGLKTPDEVRREFRRAGISIHSWAKANDFNREDVYLVLSGKRKALRGKGHRIAVALGLKTGEIVDVKSFKPATPTTLREAA